MSVIHISPVCYRLNDEVVCVFLPDNDSPIVTSANFVIRIPRQSFQPVFRPLCCLINLVHYTVSHVRFQLFQVSQSLFCILDRRHSSLLLSPNRSRASAADTVSPRSRWVRLFWSSSSILSDKVAGGFNQSRSASRMASERDAYPRRLYSFSIFSKMFSGTRTSIFSILFGLLPSSLSVLIVCETRVSQIISTVE